MSGEIAAVRLSPAGPFPCTVSGVRFLFGGAAGTRNVKVHVWEDAAGNDAPGTELYGGTHQVTASDSALQGIDLTAAGISVTGPFRVGIEFTQAGLPSVARDGDGIAAGRNFILSGGWLKAEAMGVTGDFIIRAAVDNGDTTEVRNDGWFSGGTAAFQGGFVSGEIAAVRLTPAVPFPCTVSGVRFLFGGAAGTRNVKVHVWDDAAGSDAPGTELYSGTHQVTASNDALQGIDLTAAGISVTGPFRVGIEFTQAGLPSVARDGDGIAAGRNFILSGGWYKAEAMGLTGDFIIRATMACAGGGRFVRGDANADGTTDLSDGIAILGYLFLGADVVPCEQAGDTNDDGVLDISDGVYVLGFLFLGGADIKPPAAACGVDPTGHGLPCDSYPRCP